MTNTNQIKLAKPVKRWLTLVFGFLLSGTLAYYVYLGLVEFTSVKNYQAYSSSALVFLFFIYWGVRNVPIAHRAAILFLGTRLKSVFLSEGLNWIPPFFKLRIVNCTEERHEVENFVFTSFTKDGDSGVELTSNFAIQWRVADPQLSLSIDRETLLKSIDEAAKSAARQVCSLFRDNEIMTGQDSLNNYLRRGLESQSEIWGIQIIRFFLADVSFVSIEVKRALQKRRIEKAHVEAEKMEIKLVREMLEELVNAGTPFLEAVKIVQAERGKMDRKEHIITSGMGEGGSTNPLVSAASLLADRDTGK